MTQDYGDRPRKIGRRRFCAGVAAATAAAVAPSLSRAARVSEDAAFYVAVGATLTVYRPDAHPRTFSIHPNGRMLVPAAIEPLDVRDDNTVRTVSAALSVFQIAADGRLQDSGANRWTDWEGSYSYG
jgi:hypothetical protein